MYYLNDQHTKYEYALYCRVASGEPYILPRIFYSIFEVYRFIKDLEKRHNKYHQIFYIDNDFYKNHYSLNANGIYYKFLRRPVADWEEFKNNKSTHRIINLYGA